MIILAAIILVHSWYPAECCSGNEITGDCHPISCAEIKRTDDGYEWRNMMFKGAMIRMSEDAGCHVCHGWLNGVPAYPHCLFLTGIS